jgi:hypothetical protein
MRTRVAAAALAGPALLAMGPGALSPPQSINSP